MAENDAASTEKSLTPAQLAQRAKKREKAHARRKEKKLEQSEGFGSWEYAPEKRYYNVEYRLPKFAAAQRLYIGSTKKWEAVDFSTCKDIKVVEFGCDFDVKDEHLIALANAPEEFRIGLLAIYAGGSQASVRISFQGNIFREIADKAPFPNLEHLHLLGCGAAFMGGLICIFKKCRKIQSIVATTHIHEYHMSGMLFYQMMAVDPLPTTLRYFEIVGFILDETLLKDNLIGGLSNMIPGLEMVVEPAGHGNKIYRERKWEYAAPLVKD